MENKIVGLARGTVKLVPYHPKWAEEFEEEKKILVGTLGDTIVDIQHIGSTAIPGMPAKPIIDMDLAVKSLDEIENFREKLEKVGYKYKGEQSEPERRLFAKGPSDDQTHYLHVTEFGSDFWKKDILFRDYLRSHKDAADEYVVLKKRLAETFPNNRMAYTDGKKEFLQSVVEKAQNEPK